MSSTPAASPPSKTAVSFFTKAPSGGDRSKLSAPLRALSMTAGSGQASGRARRGRGRRQIFASASLAPVVRPVLVRHVVIVLVVVARTVVVIVTRIVAIVVN